MNRILSLNNFKLCLLAGLVILSLSSCSMSSRNKSCPYKEAKEACAAGCQKSCNKLKEMEAHKAGMGDRKSCGCGDKKADKKSCSCGDKGTSCDGKM